MVSKMFWLKYVQWTINILAKGPGTTYNEFSNMVAMTEDKYIMRSTASGQEMT